MNNNIKKLIIVCEEGLHRYGDFLAQLISGKDDVEGNVVGIKDGVAGALVWTEKEYLSNAPQIMSEQYLLFIGNSKLLKEKRHHMQIKYSQYGMNYCWLGKQAALFVDQQVSYSEYDSFYQTVKEAYLKGNQTEPDRLLSEGVEEIEPQKLTGPTVVADVEEIEVLLSR